MKLWSDDFKPGETIPIRHTCDGEDISPHLAWSGVPEEAQSLALICHDPDAPKGDWIHWLVHELPPETEVLPTGGPLPQGAIEVVNDFGFSRYGGPCPPSGVHRYFFILHALRVRELSGLNMANFAVKVEEVSLARAEIMGTYGR